MKTKYTIFAVVFFALIGVWYFLHFVNNPKQENSQQAEFRIGAILPLSGKAGQYGQWIQEALELARTKINQEGGIAGSDLVIVYEDDQANPKFASSAMTKLVEVDRVPVVFGSWASSSVLAQAPIANKAAVVVMCQGISPKVRDAGDFIFRMLPDGSEYMRILVPYAVKTVQPKSALIMYVNNDFGAGLATTAEKLLKEADVKNITIQAFTQGETNFRTQITVAREKKIDAVFIFSYAEAGHILKQAKELGITSTFFASGTFENPNILKVAGDAANDVVYPYHIDLNAPIPELQSFQAKYKEKYGHPAEAFGVLAYDGLRILGDSMRKCGRNTECIRDYLYNLKGYEGITGIVSFDDHGDVIKDLVLKTVHNGEYVLLKTDYE